MEHQDFFEKVANFSCYEKLWYGNAKTFLRSVKRNEAELKPLLSSEETEMFEGCMLEQRDAQMKVLLSDLFERYISEALLICKQMLSDGQLVCPPTFVDGINTLLNISSLLDFDGEYGRLLILACQVLDLYPKYGYEPEEDDFFDEKVFDGSLIIRQEVGGDAEIRLREAEVKAIENWKRSLKH